jgi:hypothetical protein
MLFSGWSGLKRCSKGDEYLAQQEPDPSDQAMEVVADGCEDGVGGVAPTEPEIVSAHAMVGLEIADDGLDGGPSWRLMLGVTPRFWPDMKTLNLRSGGALWPRYPLSARMRSRVLPTSASISGITVAKVCPS